MLKVIIDIEANSLNNPAKIWLVVCKDIDTGKIHIWRNLHDSEGERRSFQEFSKRVGHWIGHNVVEYDFPVLSAVLLHPVPDIADVTDTLIISRLANYPRAAGHSLASYGIEFGLPKIDFNDWTHWSQEMEDYCVRDCEICCRLYLHYAGIINDPNWSRAIRLEHSFQLVVNSLHNNGFFFNKTSATRLLGSVEKELAVLDRAILEHFPPKLKPIKLIEPRRTKHGTLNKNDFRWVKDGDLSDYNGGPFCKCSWVSFNLSSPKQTVEILNKAGWKPVTKTATHIEVEREINRLKYTHRDEKGLTLLGLQAKLETMKKSGWKVNEENLNTLPETAPKPARTLARRILYESRRRTLTEWLALVSDSGRIHGKFVGIGAWTHRMAHQQPNTANIPNAYKEDGSLKLLGKELRQLWRAAPNRLLVGVDAEGIQLRIFAHYINDKEFTEAIVNGRKDNKTDPHSLNAEVLGATRAQAKRFIYALLLGGGIGKLSQILDRGEERTKEALNRLLKRYSGFDYLRREVIPTDAQRGYFIGLDGRKVRIPGDTVGERRHLCMSGYLQNGEAICMKMACLKWHERLAEEDALLVNFVHDEWQTELPNNMEVALRVAAIQSESLRLVGEELNLNCPLAGSYYNEDNKDYTIGTNWSVTH